MMTNDEMIRFAVDHLPTDEKYGKDYNGEISPNRVRAYICSYFHESIRTGEVINVLLNDDRFEIIFRERDDI